MNYVLNNYLDTGYTFPVDYVEEFLTHRSFINPILEFNQQTDVYFKLNLAVTRHFTVNLRMFTTGQVL